MDWHIRFNGVSVRYGSKPALEEIASEFEGVENSYAIQAGREIRVIVDADKVKDDAAMNGLEAVAHREQGKGNRRAGLHLRS